MDDRTIPVGPVDLAVLEAGAGGRPLLLVHGFTGAKEDFGDHLDALAARGWWVVAPDLRGHGASGQPADEQEYSFEILADDVTGLADELGWDRFVLLGHSMGGMVAQHVALRSPHRLAGLALMDTSHTTLELGDPELIRFGIAIVREQGIPALKEILDASDGPLETPAYLRLVRERAGYKEFCDRKLLASSPAMYAAMLGAMVDQADRLPALAYVDVPTLVIVGEQDEPFLAPSCAMADRMPAARRVVVADAGHSPQFENPSAWFEAVTAFLGGLG